MQLLCDALAVLGSRHGMLWNPLDRACSLVRFDRFTRQTPFHLRAGIILDGQEYSLPLAPAAHDLDFLDQRTTPCSMVLMGIHAPSCIKLRLAAVTPFRPRDPAFSTTPIIGLRLTAESLVGIFRWEKRAATLTEAEVFLEISSPHFTCTDGPAPHDLDLHFSSTRSAQWPGMKDAWDAKEETVPQHDRLLSPNATRTGQRFSRRIRLDGSDSLDLLWLTHSAPIFEVRHERCPFKYAQQFPTLDALTAWARQNPAALFDNAARVDALIADNDLSQSTNHLLAYTLHSWLLNTWWVARETKENGNEQADFFGVWEGLCYMTSTLDVEFTQAPFYLSVWPELLAIELDHWTHYTKPGVNTLGPAGDGTLYFSHDMGAHACANAQVYSHDMEVEETANWLIMLACHFRRTADDRLLHKHAPILRAALAFLERCDSTGNGVPDRGVANTIDDASPAIQFGREQVYLAVKTLAAYTAAASVLDHLRDAPRAAHYRQLAARIAAVVESQGWLDDPRGPHYATLLTRSGTLKNPWSGHETPCAEIPGWNAPQIYTTNALGLLDMVGLATPLDPAKLRAELPIATRRTLREYGCVHSDFRNDNPQQLEAMLGLAGVARSPGWISMNMARDIAAFYRGVDLRHLADRYWDWQVLTNTQEPKLFFETFAGNNLCWYPRGIAIWGFLDAAVGRTIDAVGGVCKETQPLGPLHTPNLLHTTWT